MSKAYPSNLSWEQYQLISDLIPESKLGGRKREVDMWEVLNAIFYILIEGVRWRSLPGDFPPWQTVYTYFRNWRIDGTWLMIHDQLRDWTRIEIERHPSPSEAIIDSQSVKSAAMVSQSVGFDAGKKLKGRKRFMTVDTLGLVLRVLVTAANMTKKADGYYVTFSLDDKTVPTIKPDFNPDNIVGVDVGLIDFYVASDNTRITAPKYLRKAEKRLKSAQRKVSRRQKGSTRRKKAIRSLAIQHKKVADTRKDFHFKTAKNILDKYDVVVVEKLNIKGLTKTWLSKSINDAGWVNLFLFFQTKPKMLV